MELRISFDSGTVLRLSNVKNFGFDAEDSTFDGESVNPPKFIQKKIDTYGNETVVPETRLTAN